ncbi:hypothetical protein BDF14DRAFT_1731012, partial [Spinellus fusiger]
VYLMGEFRMSKSCPEGEDISLETFKVVENSYLFRRKTSPAVAIHGLLRCINQTCREAVLNNSGVNDRLLDQYLTVCFNMIHVPRSVCQKRVIITRF